MDDIKPINFNQPVNQNEAPKLASTQNSNKKIIGLMMGLILLGVATGYGIFYLKQPKTPQKLSTATEENLKKGNVFGIEGNWEMKIIPEGTLVKGGIDGEGSHHLLREGGESQTVYLTSSIIDLSLFVDKQVKVWGQTFEAQKAGWLMDVGRLEVLE